MPSLATTAPPTEPEQELVTRFRTDYPYYSRVCLRIVDKDAKLVPLVLNRAQQIVHAKLSEQWQREGRIRAIILKARQEGISTLVAGRFMRRCSLWTHRRAMVVADVDKRSAEIFAIYERMNEHLPGEVKPKTRSMRRGQGLWFDRPLGKGLDSRITVETAKDVNVGRGSTIHCLHATELAAWDKAADTWLSLIQAVPDFGSEVIIESTAQGVGNEFHQKWQAAEEGRSGFIPIFLPWWIHEEYALSVTDIERLEIEGSQDDYERRAQDEGFEYEGAMHRLSPEQLSWRRRIGILEKCDGDERKFRQEYPSTAREAFLVAGNAFFDEDRLVELEERAAEPLRRGNLVETADGGVLFHRAERGYLRIWELPQQEGHYVIGADTAEGRLVAARDASFGDPGRERGGRDFCSADVLRVGRFEEQPDGKRVWIPPKQVAQVHGRMAPEVFAKQLAMAGTMYACAGRSGQRDMRRPALIAVERNHSSGQTVLYRLRDVLRYSRLYWRRMHNVRADKVTTELGWRTDAESRPLMLDEFSAAVREGTVDVRSAETVKEMFTFVRGDDGRPEAQEGCHDDRVISFSIALQMIPEHIEDSSDVEVPEPQRSDTPTGW